MKFFTKNLLILITSFFIYIGTVSAQENKIVMFFEQDSDLDYLNIKRTNKEAESFDNVVKLTGCKSNYSDMKKEDIFNNQYKNTLIGAMPAKIFSIKKGRILLKTSTSLKLSRAMLSLTVLDDSKTYDLEIGQKIIPFFKMDKLGGCFLPYSGTMIAYDIFD